MIGRIVRRLVASQAIEHGRLLGLYRRLCRPDGTAWAAIVRRHCGLQAVGDNCRIQMNVAITDPAFVRLGNNVHLTGCTLFGHDGSVSMLKHAYGVRLDKVGRIDIHDDVFVGHQSIIMPGVSIGPKAIVAAGAVVTRDVPPGSIVAGVPARVVGTVDDLVARLQAETATLPWSDDPGLAPDHHGPASERLEQRRAEHFFGAKARAAEASRC